MSGKEIKVSVVIATYNHEKYIRHTLESIVSQKVNFVFEVLIGEDCSTDGTAAIVREYAEKYPDLIVPLIRETNLGMGRNSIDLIMRTRGEFVALIEGDDYWTDDNKLQKQVDFLDAHQDYIACFGKSIIVDENEVRQQNLERYSGFLKRGGEYSIKDFEEYLLPGQTATSMYRKSAYDQFQRKLNDPSIDSTKFIDRHIVLIMLSFGKIYVLDEEIAAYRYVMKKGSGSWSSENDYYAVQTLMNYLDGLKEFERLAGILGLTLDFDARRIYEWDKLEENLDSFSKTDIRVIRQKIVSGFNDPHKKTKYRLKSTVLGKVIPR